jgi:hypothetical protein
MFKAPIMQSKKYTPEEIALFNSKLGKYSLLKEKKSIQIKSSKNSSISPL